MAEPAKRLEEPTPLPAPAEVATPASEAEAEQPRLLDTDQQAGAIDLVTALRLIAEQHGQPYQQTVVEMAKLSFGAGKVTVGEYIDFGLYEKGRTLEEKRAYVGLTAMRQIWDTANYLREWWGLLENKLAATTLLGGWGFPVIPTKGVYSQNFRIPGLPRLTCREELMAFLADPANYPMFGKPIDSLRSLGSMSLEALDSTRAKALKTTGGEIPLSQIADEIIESYAAGYIFQGRVRPHAAIRAICGERLATLRVVTIRMGNEIKVPRVLWKIPAGANVADNFWRPGNMIAQLDRTTGKVLRVQRGTGLAARTVELHPDTGARLIGAMVPDYEGLLETAVEAHRMFADIGIIGWDMAATEQGPVIVEPNVHPDFVLPQLADGRGIMDDEFRAFLASRKAEKDALKVTNRKALAEDARARNLGRLTGKT